MANYAELVDNEVRFYDRTLVDTKSIEDVFATFAPEKPWTTDRLPEGCVFMGSRANFTLYIVERPPRIVSLRFNDTPQGYYDRVPPKYDSDGQYYLIPVPWEYYAMAIANVPTANGFGTSWREASPLSLFWAAERVTDSTTKGLVPAALPNISLDGSVCLGETGTDLQEPAPRFDIIVNEFYDSDFNGDLGLSSGIAPNFERWVDYGERNDTVDLTDRLFATFARACRRDDALSIDEILQQQASTAQLPALDDDTMPAEPREFLTALFEGLPRIYRARLAGMLRNVAHEAP